MGVGGDGVGALNARGEVSGTRGQRREEPERAVDVQPGAELLGQAGKVGQRIEVTGVGLARSGDQHSGRSGELAQASPHSGQVDPADVVSDKDLDRVLTVAEHLQSLTSAGVHIAARNHRHPGQAGQPGRGRIHAMQLGPPVGGQRQTGEVGKGRARRQRPTPARRQAGQLAKPVQGDRFRRVGQARRGPHERVLVQQGDDPVGGQR